PGNPGDDHAAEARQLRLLLRRLLRRRPRGNGRHAGGGGLICRPFKPIQVIQVIQASLPRSAGEVAASYADGGRVAHDGAIRPLRPRQTRAPPLRGVREGEGGPLYFCRPPSTPRTRLPRMPALRPLPKIAFEASRTAMFVAVRAADFTMVVV